MHMCCMEIQKDDDKKTEKYFFCRLLLYSEDKTIYMLSTSTPQTKIFDRNSNFAILVMATSLKLKPANYKTLSLTNLSIIAHVIEIFKKLKFANILC